MSDGIFSPMLRDLLIFVCLTVSILAFVFAAYAWTMMQEGQKKYVRMQSFMDEYDKMKDRLKDVESRLRKEEIKLKATMAANRLGRAGLIPTLKEGEAAREPKAVRAALRRAPCAGRRARRGRSAAERGRPRARRLPPPARRRGTPTP